MPWSNALAGLIRAGVALARGTPEKEGLLREAAAGFDHLDMPLYGAAAWRLLGRHIGGDEGASLVAKTDAWMREQRIQNPPRLAAMLAPSS